MTGWGAAGSRKKKMFESIAKTQFKLFAIASLQHPRTAAGRAPDKD